MLGSVGGFGRIAFCASRAVDAGRRDACGVTVAQVVSTLVACDARCAGVFVAVVLPRRAFRAAGGTRVGEAPRLTLFKRTQITVSTSRWGLARCWMA